VSIAKIFYEVFLCFQATCAALRVYMLQLLIPGTVFSHMLTPQTNVKTFCRRDSRYVDVFHLRVELLLDKLLYIKTKYLD